MYPSKFLWIGCLTLLLPSGCQPPPRNGGQTREVIPESRTTVLLPREGIFHIVQPGETLTSICKAYNKSVEAIRSVNGLSENEILEPGQQVFLPGCVPLRTPRPKPRDSEQPMVQRYRGPRRVGLIWPLKGEVLVKYRQPIVGVPSEGITIAASTGSAVWAVQDGTVMFCSNNFLGLGKVVILEHSSGMKSLYSHLAETLVKEGERIQQGDVIGQAGKSGRADRPQLHLRIYKNGQTLDPLAMLR